MDEGFKSKTKKVLNHLITKGDISTWEAIELYRATRLSAIIFNLRKQGFNIESRDEVSVDSEGKTLSRYTRYYLLDVENHVPHID